MLVLFETAAGYALFKVVDKGILKNADNVASHFESPATAGSAVVLKGFKKFDDTTKAVAAAAAICDGKLDKTLKKFLKASIVDKEINDKLALIDSKLGGLIKEKLGIKCVNNEATKELFRGIRTQLDSLLTGLPKKDLAAMKLGLAHSLGRYKLKFSPDKVDVMIIQSISLLDELDKELNTYAMRVREWYGWHFPELARVLSDNMLFAKTVKVMGMRQNASKTDLSEVLPEELEQEVKEQAEISMGTEISEEDISNIQQLADQVISITQYRTELFNYLKNRMSAIAPNLTCMVGELVGARLIAHAGSLLSLAKHPASTVQILGAEKALFRALKTKHDTPKYGLIYHASLVGQAAPKLKGKISRVLAAKTALSIRQDALGDSDGVTIGLDARAAVENRLAHLEGGASYRSSGSGSGKSTQYKYDKSAGSQASYNEAADVTMKMEAKPESDKAAKKSKKAKKEKEAAAVEEPVKKSKKKKSKKSEEAAEVAVASDKKEKKKKKRKAEGEAEQVVEEGEKKKKKKKQKQAASA